MKYNPKLRRAQIPKKAYKNPTFLNSREARNIRIQCELTEPAVRLKSLGIDHLISFFGSARSKPSSQLYKDSENLSYMIGEWLQSNSQYNVAVSSGGGPGVMEAVNKGASRSGCPSVGMGISLPFEQENNEFVSDDLSFEFHYFFTRKYWCTYLTKAFVVMPGGVGTLDELFEILTLIQTQKLTLNIPIVLYGADFWNRVISFDTLVEYGTISRDDLKLFKVCDTVEESFNYIIDNICYDR